MHLGYFRVIVFYMRNRILFLSICLLLTGGVDSFCQTNNGYQPTYTGTGNGAKTGGTAYYVDYVSGSDSNPGTSKTSPWKAAPGMACATAAAASHSIANTDQILLKGGVTWPAACIPWNVTGGGTTTKNAKGYPGLYIGYDPAWNAGVVNSVRVTDPGSCTSNVALTVSLSGGGGSGAAATANIETDTYAAGDLSFVTVAKGGSGYTSNPSVTFTVKAGTCTVLPTAYADILSPIIDGNGTVFGSSTGIAPMITYNSQYGTMDHLEIKNYNWYIGSYSGGSPTILGGWGNNMEFRNLYIHNFGANGAVNGTYLVGALNAAQTAAVQGGGAGSYTYFTNNVLNNYEKEISGGCIAGNGNSGHCVQNTAIYNFQYATNNVITSWRGGLYTEADAASGYLVAGNKMWGILSDANTQHADCFYLQGGTVSYNNILRDFYPGAAAFYTESMNGYAAGNVEILFNNVIFGIGTDGAGTSTPPMGWSSEFAPSSGNTAPTPILASYNNTMYANVGNTFCINSGQWFGASCSMTVPVTVQNNYCVSSQAAGHWIESGGCGTWNGIAGASLSAQLDNTAVIQSPTAASSAGYTQANNFAPISASSPTVAYASSGNSVNLTSLCSTSVGGVSLANLCYDINGNPRPATGGWQAGAYQFSSDSGSQPPAPPTNLNGTKSPL